MRLVDTIRKWAAEDAAAFAEEFPGETLEPTCDWDSAAWTERARDLPEGADAGKLWAIYHSALHDEIKRLAKA